MTKLDYYPGFSIRSLELALLLPFVIPYHEQNVDYPAHIYIVLIEWKKMDNSQLNLISLGRVRFSEGFTS